MLKPSAVTTSKTLTSIYKEETRTSTQWRTYSQGVTHSVKVVRAQYLVGTVGKHWNDHTQVGVSGDAISTRVGPTGG